MAKNLVDGTNIIIEENGDNINLNLSSTYTSELEQTINTAIKEVYSTEETVVGTWMGKPLYKKTINFGSFPNATTTRIPHEISNIEIVPFFLYGWYDSEDKLWYSNGRAGSDNVICLIHIDSTSVILQGGRINWTNRTSNGNVTIYYTKTTDSGITN